jgi:calpain-5
LDENGFALNKELQSADYMRFFSVNDIYQGWIGNCYHIGAMMALTRNELLLEKIIPKDNTLRENINLGAFHFRFWKLGFWYDVVVDDYLPTDSNLNLLFSHNKIYPNEFWVPLFEKAFAK